MDTTITFTPSELVAFIGALFAFIASIGAGVAVIAKLITKIRKPELEQNKKIEEHDKKLEEHDKIIETFRTYFANDDKRFKAIERSNKVTQSALLALMKHALNDGDIATLKNAEKQLEDFLIEK